MLYKTALIVPTFSRESSLIIDTLISNINNQSIGDVDIIVVNNNIFPLQLQNKFYKWELIVLNGKKNLWSAGGFYLGMKFAYEKKYDVYILGDDDAVLLDQDAIEVLSKNIIENQDTAYQLTWKERKDAGMNTSAAYSCYGGFSHKMLLKYGYYSPFFFYWWEDAAYEWTLRSGGIKFSLLSPMFSHPVKRWMTLSRWSSWLSTFRHNSILQHFWTIFFSSSFQNAARSVVVIQAYLIFLFYGLIWMGSYFRSQMWLNLRNIFCYIPPILLQKQGQLFYPRYRDAQGDQEFSIKNIQDVNIISEQWVLSPNYSTSRDFVLDTWFPVMAIWWREWLKILWKSRTISLLHGYQDDDKVQIKLLIDFWSLAKKMSIFLISILLVPVVIILTIIIFLILFFKYLCVRICLYIWESRYFLYYTSEK